jgi:photosystem II stability/assembly factor-like uncharacterized protein
MAAKLLVATADGLALCEREGETWRLVERALGGRALTSVAAAGEVLLAGSREGVMRSEDGGRNWVESADGMGAAYIRCLTAHPTIEGLFLAGAEPAAIFVSRDGGRSWRECGEVARLREQHGWFLPYSPGAGCVRSFACAGERIYAAVEVGGALRSDDAGQTWRLVGGSSGNPDFRAPVPRTKLQPDVHEVVVVAGNPDWLLAPTMQGLYRSGDGGEKWVHLYADCYTRSVWVDPDSPGRWVLGPADDVEINGQIEESSDGGWSWRLASDGLQVPWRRAIVERFTQAGDELLAVLSSGELYAAPTATLRWRRVLADLGPVAAVAAC